MPARCRAVALRKRIRAAALGRVEAPDDADGRVRHHPPLDLARRLLGADDAEAPAALGDIEEHFLNGAAPAFAPRATVVELVEHEEDKRPGRAGLLLEQPLNHNADHKTLGAIVEIVDVDHRDLPRFPN